MNLSFQMRAAFLLALLSCCAGSALAQDCNANNVNDADEIASGTVQDCNANGIPDVCEATLVVDRNLTAGGVPISLQAADLDGDQRVDLVYANRSANSVVVLLSDGTGNFTAQPFPVGASPQWVTVADLNGDGLPDLAVANGAGNDVSILINSGQSGPALFSAPSNVAVGTGPTYIVALDLDADGDLDLAVANGAVANVRKLINSGQGTFTSAGDQPVGLDPVAIAAADFDGDGRSDLAVANFTSNNLSVLLTSGVVPPATTASFGAPFALAAGDFTGDGRIDLAVANFNSSTILILANQGNGSFVTQTELREVTGPVWVSVADMNGDAKLDLLVVDNTGVLIYLGNGVGGFSLFRRGAVGSGFDTAVVAPLTSAEASVAALNPSTQQLAILRVQPLECPAPGGGDTPAPPACGAGTCGTGGATMMPLTLGALLLMRNAGRRRTGRP